MTATDAKFAFVHYSPRLVGVTYSWSRSSIIMWPLFREVSYMRATYTDYVCEWDEGSLEKNPSYRKSPEPQILKP